MDVSLVVGIVGTVVTLAGMGITIWQARRAKGYAQGLEEARDDIRRLQRATVLAVLCEKGGNAVTRSRELAPGIGRQARGFAFARDDALRVTSAYVDETRLHLHHVPAQADHARLRELADQIDEQLGHVRADPQVQAQPALHAVLVESLTILQRVRDGAPPPAAPPGPAVPGGRGAPALLP